MARRFRYGGGYKGPPRRVAYRMVNGRKFYEKSPRAFPYGTTPYVEPYYWVVGYAQYDVQGVEGFLGVKLWQLLLLQEPVKAPH